MMEKKVSIVIPVYNVSQYLPKCLDSLIHQTYKNIEIIAVDDSSTDDSLAILNSYALKDHRIKALHKPNGGAGSARNYGLEHVTGEYLSFVDSDDYVDSHYIESLVHQLEQSNADISICSYYNVYTDKTTVNDYQCDILEFNDEQFLRRFLSDWTCALIWNKLFKIELLKDIRFVEGHKIDDEFFTYQLVMNSKKIVLLNKPLYYYLRRSDSVMNIEKNKDAITNDRLDFLEQRFNNVASKYSSLRKEYLNNYYESLIKLYNDTTNDIIKKQIKQNSKYLLKEILKYSYHLKYKLVCIYAYLNLK